MTKVTSGFECMSDRYKYDFRLCTSANGWAQIDTKQDASYYGTWANPITFKLMNYCEGDTTLTECDTEEEFIAAVQSCVNWNKESGYFIGIDGMCNETIIAAFNRMNLGEYLH